MLNHFDQRFVFQNNRYKGKWPVLNCNGTLCILSKLKNECLIREDGGKYESIRELSIICRIVKVEIGLWQKWRYRQCPQWSWSGGLEALSQSLRESSWSGDGLCIQGWPSQFLERWFTSFHCIFDSKLTNEI